MSHYSPWNTQTPPAPAPVTQNVQLRPAVAMLSPALAIQQMTGLGQTTDKQKLAIGAGLGILLIGVTAVLSYYAGAAMAPSPSGRKTWGIVGIPVGMFTGAWGLGVMGIVAGRR